MAVVMRLWSSLAIVPLVFASTVAGARAACSSEPLAANLWTAEHVYEHCRDRCVGRGIDASGDRAHRRALERSRVVLRSLCGGIAWGVDVGRRRWARRRVGCRREPIGSLGCRAASSWRAIRTGRRALGRPRVERRADAVSFARRRRSYGVALDATGASVVGASVRSGDVAADDAPLLMRYAGGSWTMADSRGSSADLFSVATVPGRSTAWVVGQNPNASAGADACLALEPPPTQ